MCQSCFIGHSTSSVGKKRPATAVRYARDARSTSTVSRIAQPTPRRARCPAFPLELLWHLRPEVKACLAPTTSGEALLGEADRTDGVPLSTVYFTGARSIAPGDGYSYNSGCSLPTPAGTIRGSYRMVAVGGLIFDAAIPEFVRAVPSHPH